VPAPDREITGDFRQLAVEELDGYDCVCHLAAISNDPMGDLDESLTLETNLAGTIALAEKAKAAGVSRFLFSGSCSVYGKGESLDLDESACMCPVSTYARSKVEAEAALLRLADDAFSPVILRNATAYGASPMLRVDLVANNLLACAFARGDIRIMSDGTPWRPLVHCLDIARAFVALAQAPRERVHKLVVNVGGNEENYQVRDVADAVQGLLPGARVVYTGEVGEDPRNYRVNFDRLNRTLPDFRLQHSLATGLEELLRDFRDRGFSVEDFEGPRFVRLRTLKRVLQESRP